jgi:hypothetical protein
MIDLINAKNKKGAVAFLDQEKAFDIALPNSTGWTGSIQSCRLYTAKTISKLSFESFHNEGWELFGSFAFFSFF